MFRREFGALNRTVICAGWKLLLVDSNPGDNPPLAAEQLDWIREQLKATDANTPLVLCTHHPLMPHTKSSLLAGADQVLALCKEHNLKAALAGHYHGNQEEIADGVLFTTTACLSTTRSNFDGSPAKGYRLFHCRNGEIVTEFVPVQERDR